MKQKKKPIKNMKIEILNTADRLFRERGYEKTTYQMIADELGISKGSISYHYQGKPWILFYFFKRKLDAIYDFVRLNLTTGFNYYLFHCVAQIYYFRQIIKDEKNRILYFNEDHIDLWVREKYSIIKEYYQEITDDFHKNLSPGEVQIITIMAMGAQVSLNKTFIRHPEGIDVESFCYHFVYIIGLFSKLDEMTIQTNIQRAYDFLREHSFPEFALL